MNAHLEPEIRELAGFLGCNNPKMAEIAIKAVASLEPPGAAEALLLVGLASGNPQVAWRAAFELLKMGKMDIDEVDHVCVMQPAKRKITVILKASGLENRQLAAELLSHWLADEDSAISGLAKEKLAELGKETAAPQPGPKVERPVDRDAIRKAFPDRATAYEKIQRKLKS